MMLSKDTREHRIYILCLDIEVNIENKDLDEAETCIKEVLHYFHKGTHYPLSRRWNAEDVAPQ